jgi:hypothetical protein
MVTTLDALLDFGEHHGLVAALEQIMQEGLTRMTQKALQLGPNVQGWKQFLTARKEMLDAFDRARTKAGLHKVTAAHGATAKPNSGNGFQIFFQKSME